MVTPVGRERAVSFRSRKTGSLSRDSIYENQGLHFLLLLALLLPVGWISRTAGFLDGSCLGVSTATWFWLSILFPVLHQVWVWICWRMELHYQWLSGPNDSRNPTWVMDLINTTPLLDLLISRSTVPMR